MFYKSIISNGKALLKGFTIVQKNGGDVIQIQ